MAGEGAVGKDFSIEKIIEIIIEVITEKITKIVSVIEKELNNKIVWE